MVIAAATRFSDEGMLAVPATELKSQPPLGLELDSLALIDTSTLSQSELHALSLCSASAFDLRRTDDVIDPVIDRSTFNESAGSRRQTYSATGHRRRIAGLLPAAKHPAAAPSGDSEHAENKIILGFLKRFINENPRFTEADLVPPPVPRTESRREVVVYQKPASFGGENKRKRGRKPKARIGAEEQGLEILNRNGVAVDLLGLENSEDLYGDEFRRRTAGMESEEELLGFLNELDGQWGSRRKRRKFVDADHFGDALPVGWKLLLGLKRREGRASIYCRRYISPGGKQFVTCREASLYLQSYSGRSYTRQPNNQRVDKIQRENIVVSQRQLLGVTPKEEDPVNDIVISSSSLPCIPASNMREKEVNMMEIGKLADVQINDLFECRKCNETFDERDAYLQHLLSSHQRTTRRYRLGSSVGDGVIVRDGKYECQFCHKVFQERRRYNGHVGIHVRNYVRKVEVAPSQTSLQTRIESPNTDDTRRISKMDALIEIAQSSIRETTDIEEPNCNSIPGKINMVSAPEIPVADSAQEMKVDSPLSELDIEGRMIGESRGEESCQQDSESNLTNGKVQKPNKAINVVAKVDSGLAPALHTNDQNCKRAETFDGKDGVATTTDEINKSGIALGRSSDSHLPSPLGNKKPSDDQSKWISTSDLEFGFNNDGGPDNNVAGEPIQRTQENAIPFDVSDSLMPLVQPVHSFSASNLNLDKGQGDLSVELGHDNVTGFEELGLDEFEPLKFNFVSGQQSPSLQEIPMDLADNSEAGKVYDFTDQFAQLTTACVWCGVEFSHDAVDSEIQSDSVGFMCPTCKAKISGQLNILGAGASMNSHQL